MHTKIINDTESTSGSEDMDHEDTETDQDSDYEEFGQHEDDDLPPPDILSVKEIPNCLKKVEKIIGTATDENGERLFLIKWKNIMEPELLPAAEANVRCTVEVIQFYENRIVWPATT
ncbi:Chromo shadow domain,Chromo/chromo shadow domain,Chromo domain-like [Cinara cedri]|uniref:Chromo shadow domain,Chromo/chromo shadow domain,Chromo domain-like n=1 Tax=Cinara cedri TaxID=506608 RepID=A0A5E4NC84_9HEMI|nr:Chromo shadow domain,Chromo/chromo shadow domain,Chromo domain-like [Cinara cedri]